MLIFTANKFDNPYKGTDVLLNSLKLIKCKEKIRLLMIGNDEGLCLPDEYLQSRMGYVTDEKSMNELYTVSDALLMPSDAGNFSCTILESMACGTPVIGSDVGSEL